MLVDYSLYLVTDSTPEILGDRSLPDVVEAAIRGGVTIVQYRDKSNDTAHLIRTARELHKITKANNVPLIINDRVDVAIAIGAEGVHIGQDDIDIAIARKLLGPKKDAIIGVSASCFEEAKRAVERGASYLGIGSVFATATKKDTKSIIGPSGVRNVLTDLSKDGCMIPCVCIGGINASNIQRVLFQTKTPKLRLAGAAVVSAIVASTDPERAANDLKRLIETPQPPFQHHQQASSRVVPLTSDMLHSSIPAMVAEVVRQNPLCHNMTNTVVQTFAANVAIAIGGSPIMSSNGAEAADLARLNGSLVINMGTVTPDSIGNYLEAVAAYNATGNPVVLDPVGAGATRVRREALATIMDGGYFDLIKGNEGEIKTVAGAAAGAQQRGVDSGSSDLGTTAKVNIVRSLAQREQCVVLMTGKTDILSDGMRTVLISNGHEYMGLVTGSGCTLGTTIAAFLAVHGDDKFMAALAGILLYEIAAEHAARRDDVRGPGTFLPAWVDELYRISHSPTESNDGWITEVKVESIG